VKKEVDRSATTVSSPKNVPRKNGEKKKPKTSVTFSFPSRVFAAAGLVVSISTILGSVFLNRWFEHDIGGIYWPYLSDAAKAPPECNQIDVFVSSILFISFSIHACCRSIDRKDLTLLKKKKAAVFGFGLTLTAVLIACAGIHKSGVFSSKIIRLNLFVIVTLNYGKLKRDIEMSGAENKLVSLFDFVLYCSD